MNQSALIGGALIAGFVLFLARQDRLSAYAGVFFGDKPATHATGTGSSGSAVVVPGLPPFHIPTWKDVTSQLPSLPSLPDLGLPGLANDGWGMFGASSGTNG